MVETSAEIQARWKQMRETKYSTVEAPSDWPPGVRMLTMNGLSLFGISDNGQLYFDGQPLVTERRWSTVERRIAWSGVILAAIGVAATAVQAWMAVFPHPPVT
jgi:hypothetical protein